MNLGELENLSMVEGKLSNTRTSDKRPLEGIGETFKRIKQSQKLTNEDKSVLVRWIDAFITVSTHPDTVGHDVAVIARAVNMHHCTKTCRKKGTNCRFKFPKPPSPKTIIQEQPKEGNEEKRNQSVAKGLETIRKVMEVLEDERNIEKIMSQFNKETETSAEMTKNRKIRINEVCILAGVSYQDYIEALEMTSTGYKVVLARDIDELQINPFNKEMLRAWNGNMDLQPVLDFFAVVTYVADYYAKDDTGMMELIKAATEDSSTKDVKDKMKQIANIFQMTRQIGEAEAVYRLIPSMTMSMSNIKCVFVPTGPKEERSVRWKKATDEQLNQVNAIRIADRDGLWFQQPDLLDKYFRRPADIKEITFSQFAKMYVGRSRKAEDEDEEAIDDHEEDDDDDDENKFNYIMTFKNNGSKGKKLPDIIKLSDPAPGEAQFMAKRTFPSALRFQKIKAENHKRFMLNELMLYCPLDDEVKEDEIEIKYNDLHGKKRKVDIIKNQVMEHLEGVQEARYHVAQMQKELDIDLDEVAAIDLDPAGYHDNEDCASEGDEENDNFQHCNPDQLNIGSDEPNEPALFRKIEMPSDDELKSMTRDLDFYQREVVNKSVKFARDIVKARKKGNKHPDGPLMMVSGGAGAGKSTVIRVVEKWVQKIVQKEGDSVDHPCVVKAAFTGCAATNIEASTLHSAFGFSFSNKHFSLSDKTRDKKRAAMQNLVLVIIDEISMVSADQLYMLDLRLQEIKERVGTVFGGVGVMVLGDLMQLKPIQGRMVFDTPSNPDFQATDALDSRWRKFESVLLEKNHRQGKDGKYADILNRVRIGDQTEEDLKELQKRVFKETSKGVKRADIYLGCKRNEVSEINMKYIKKLPGACITLKAKHHHPTQKNYKPQINKKDGNIANTAFQDEVLVKIGAKLMIINNIDVIDMLSNGQIGVLEEVIKSKDGAVEILVIRLKDSKAGKKNQDKFSHLKDKFPGCVFIERIQFQYNIRKKSGDVGSAAILIQFPVKVSNRVTAHKIQGNTLASPTKVAMDFRNAFQSAQTYVMLSRIQRIEQLYIVEELKDKMIMTNQNALRELRRLEETSINRNPTPWHQDKGNLIKVASLNCCSLYGHFIDIRNDEKLLQADVLHLQETSLAPDFPEERLELEGYTTSFIKIGRGKGIGSYTNEKVDHQILTTVGEPKLQVSKVSLLHKRSNQSNEIQLFNIYRSSDSRVEGLIDHLLDLVEVDKPTLITGDLNICNMKEPQNRLTMLLTRMGFKLLVNEATHIQGGHIDHAYWIDPAGGWQTPSIERYSPYYSDHDGLLITLKR